MSSDIIMDAKLEIIITERGRLPRMNFMYDKIVGKKKIHRNEI